MFDGIFQPMHLLVILLICLLLFGPAKLPQLGRGLGESIKEFKKAMAEARSTETPAEPAKSNRPSSEDEKK